MVTAVILAGGNGTRVGADRPKQFVEVWGKPILAYTIEIYQKHSEVDSIEIVCHKQWIEYVKEMVCKYNLTKVKWITVGGETFQESVINGMNNLKGKISLDDIVMVHYGAAPFTSKKIISDAIKICEIHETSVSCTPCYQLMGTNDGEISEKWVDRDEYIQIACPQSFKFNVLQEIYEKSEKNNILKDTEPHTTSLMYKLGMPIYKSYGDQTNIKITTSEDIELFRGYAYILNSSISK